MGLTDTWLRAARGVEKPYKKSDGGGLYILVQADGKRYWRMAYRFAGKQKTLALGSYPLISLKEARDARDAAKKKLLEGIDPSAARKAEKATIAAADENRFETIAREWHDWKKRSLTDRYAGQVLDRLEDNVFPEIGHLPIDAIEPPTILAMLQKIEERGAITMAKRVKEHCSQIFRYAIVKSKAKRDPCADLRGALRPNPPVRHHQIVRFNELPQLLRDIDNYNHIGEELTKLALQLASLTLLRTSELRKGQWPEIGDLDAKELLWCVPDPQMKMKGRDGHLVPLSRQAVAVLRELHKLTGYGKFMFPGEKPGACMSNNTMLFALYRMGYRSRQTVHGFRRIASTILNEAGFRPDAIEKQLAHEEENKVRGAYNAAEYLAERREMLQWYADYLDAIRVGKPAPERAGAVFIRLDGNNVIPIRQAG
jgi:integrase